MKISELVAILDQMKKTYGDLDVRVLSLSHSWAPEPVVQGKGSDQRVILNP